MFFMDTPLVSICCLVYNHEPFLRECFEGFVMQKTTFPIEVLVHDDASTDHSADIIREYTAKYPDIFKPIYQTENQYSKGKGFVGLQLNFERAQGKYIAMCEGDDYWTDPLKLQKQVDFLEKNEDYSFCATGYDVYNQEESSWEEEYDNSIWGNFDINVFYNHWLVQLLTVVFHRDMVDIEETKKYKLFRDYHLYYFLLKKGNGFKLNDITGVYRKHNGGVNSKGNELFHLKTDYEVVKDLYMKNRHDTDLENQVLIFLDNYHHFIVVHLRDGNFYRNLLYVFIEYFRLKGGIFAATKVWDVFYPHLYGFVKNRLCR